jgi:predicted transcriptional regulator
VSSLIRITEAECAILEPLWRVGPLTPPRLLAEVGASQPWAQTTIKTLLGRLMRKKAVRSEKDDEGVLRYRALVDRASYVETEVQALADRVFGGDLDALARYLAARPRS